MKTFYFNTGVRVHVMEYADKGRPKYYAPTDVISPNGVRLIPFDCEDVPETATFKFCAPSPDLYPDKDPFEELVKKLS